MAAIRAVPRTLPFGASPVLIAVNASTDIFMTPVALARRSVGVFEPTFTIVAVPVEFKWVNFFVIISA